MTPGSLGRNQLATRNSGAPEILQQDTKIAYFKMIWNILLSQVPDYLYVPRIKQQCMVAQKIAKIVRVRAKKVLSWMSM